MNRFLLKTFFVFSLLFACKSTFAQWQKVIDIDSFPRSRGIAFVLKDTVYLGNGDPGFFVYTKDFEGYTQNGNTWIKEPAFGGPGGDEGFHFVIGDTGYVGDGASPGYWNGLWEYNPAIGWKQKATPPGGSRAFCTGFSIGTKGYFGTGSSGGVPYNDFYEYDPSTNTWTTKASLPVHRLGCASFSANGYGYIGLGGNNTGATFRDMYRYNPVLNKWDTMASMPSDTGMEEPAYFVICNKLIVTCGDSVQSGNSTTKQTWMFDPSNGPKGTWTRLQDFPGPLPAYSPTGWSMGDTGFVYGGYDQYAGNLYRQDMYRYVPTPNMLAITVSATPADTNTCASQPVTLSVTDGFSYLWNTGETTDSITVSPTDTTSYNVIVTNGQPGCIGYDTIKVNATPIPSVTFSGNSSVCAGAPITITANGGNNYVWSDGSTTSTITITPLTDTTYTVSVSNGLCSKDTSFAVKVNPVPTSSAGNLTNVRCSGGSDGSVTLNPSGGTSPYTYAWSPSGGNNAMASNLSAGSYTCTITDSNGCATADTITILQPTAITAFAAATDAKCAASNGSAIVSASGGAGDFTYSWNPGGATNDSVSGLSAGTYIVTITDSNGCATSDTAIINNTGEPIDSVCCGATITSGQNVVVSVVPGTSGNTYSWTPSSSLSCDTCASPIASPTVSTWYHVTITDSLGCSITDSVLISVKEKCGDIYVPTAFSPNGDGWNDVLQVMGNCIQQMTFDIYDRWGNKVFESTDPKIGWDGTYKGQPMNTGTYVFILTAIDYNNNTTTKKGNITLVR